MPTADAGVRPDECPSVPLRTLPALVQTARTYLNQRDNRRVGLSRLGSLVSADAQCSSTSLTMSLLSLYGGDRTALLDECHALAREQGSPLDDAGEDDIELAVMDVILGTDWDRATRRAPTFFEGRDWRPRGHRGNRIVKNPFAQAYTAARFSRCGDAGVSIASASVCLERGQAGPGLDQLGRWSWAQQMWQSGAEVSLQARFTGGGHVVHALEVSANDLVVHDPYGMCLAHGRYVRNGLAGAPLSGRLKAVAERRARRNPGLLEKLANQAIHARWGERNVYTRADLFALDGPEWVLAIGTGGARLA